MSARVYCYARGALGAAYTLGAFGGLGAAALLVFVQPAPAVRWVLAALAALYLVYFVRTALRHLTRIELDAGGLGARGPLGVTIGWDDVRAIRLTYYSTRQDRSKGWMEFVVQGARKSIRIDSSLEGFPEIVGEAVREAQRRGIAIDERSSANLRALGIGE